MLLGMPLLVVFGGEGQQVFYLDRILLLDPGTVFAIVPLGQSCAVNLLWDESSPLQMLPPMEG